jgi:hypothetical protein
MQRDCVLVDVLFKGRLGGLNGPTISFLAVASQESSRSQENIKLV